MLAKTFWGYRQELPSPHRAWIFGELRHSEPHGRLPSSPALVVGPWQKGQHRSLAHKESTVPVPAAPGSGEG